MTRLIRNDKFLTAKRSTPHGFAFAILLAICIVAGCALPALAQVTPELNEPLTELKLRGQGWAQVLNREELLDILLAILETGLLVAALAFHPADRRTNRSRADLDTPFILFVYGLIGMFVGFLVIHHGYLIGFVIFGIGGLLRFKNEIGSEDLLTKVIVVTLTGLAVGLNFPLMALVLAATFWGLAFVFGRNRHHVLHVQFKDNNGAHPKPLELRSALKNRGYIVNGVHSKKGKKSAEFVLTSPREKGVAALQAVLTELQGDPDLGLDDWTVE